MVKKFHKRQMYSLCLVYGKNGEPYMFIQNVTYVDKYGDERKFINSDYQFFINGNKCRIIDREDDKENSCFVANIVKGWQW